ncbi:MAG TPA: 5-deoxy-glucuronate isomerase, partial [Magnetospirillaceae bacterium]|nr:5-deoxy-glucuronate isomerase [Magnetospirillaceae bacterium]
MDIREYVNSEYAKTLDTEGLRSRFLVSGLFYPDAVRLTYSHVDRMIVGGITPGKAPLSLAATRDLGTEYFLERREMGVLNIGGSGSVQVDGARFALGHRDGLYLSMGSREVVFRSDDPDRPARFYLNSAPAHRACS